MVLKNRAYNKIKKIDKIKNRHSRQINSIGN